VLGANCDATSCIAACNKNETMLMASCGARKAAAHYPTPDSATCPRHEAASNPLIAVCVTGASLSAVARPTPEATPRTATAGSAPRFDVAETCRGAQDSVGDRGPASVESCMKYEQGAHEKLNESWRRYARGDTNHCTQLSSLRGFQSYVELLTCLEMASEARTLPKE
jgi:hypothetical protein